MLWSLTLVGPADARAASTTPPAFQGQALWVEQLPAGATPASLAAQLVAAGVSTVYVKAGDGTTPDPQFTAALVSGLHAAGVRVCGWTFIYGSDPAAEAAVAAGVAQDGADCVVYDAEGAYDKLYGAAQQFIASLRAAVGVSYPLGLATQPYVDEHPTFPYSVFLGPGASNVVLPLAYWQDLGGGVAAVLKRTFAWMGIYGRPIAPVGQLYDDPSPTDIAAFRTDAGAGGAPGVSFFDLDAATAAGLAALTTPIVRPRVLVPLPSVLPGADGDEVLWAQELLNAAGAHLPVGGFFGAQTASAVAHFQRARRLPVTGRLGNATWLALLKRTPRQPSWLSAPPVSAQ
jgi:hypothetical protein